MTFLALYRDPVVAHVTRCCDWRIEDLVSGDRPATLYLVIPPSDISRTRSLMRLILNQIGRRLMEKLTPDTQRHRLLFMLDEFPALGRLDFFESQLAFMAGYGIKAFLIAQSLNQIEKAYGHNNAILDNCHVRVAFAANDERTARRISDALGTATETRDAKNYAGHRLSPWLGHLMISRQETARPLLTPGEVMQLPEDDEIVLVSGLPPIRAKKARYYADPEFKRRVLPPPEPGQLAGDVRAMPEPPASGDWPGPAAAGGSVAVPMIDSDPDSEGGLRREPELPEHEDIVPDKQHQDRVCDEFAELDDENNDSTLRAERMRDREKRQPRSIARQAALDPDDGIEL